MYSYAQCTVLERLVCSGDVQYPVWPIWSRNLAPSTLSTYPPPYLPGVVGTQFTGSLQEGWIWTVKWRFAASPTQILCFWIMYAILSLVHLESCFWSVYQMIGCLVLIAVIFLGWLTTTRNKRVSSCAFITFSWAVSRIILVQDPPFGIVVSPMPLVTNKSINGQPVRHTLTAFWVCTSLHRSANEMTGSLVT